jgi:predicted Holliday junction resolvase-like endonuclease
MIEMLILGGVLILLLVVAVMEQAGTINRLESELRLNQQKIIQTMTISGGRVNQNQTQSRFEKRLYELNCKALKREAGAREKMENNHE